MCEMEIKVSGMPGREKKEKGGVQDGLSRVRLTEVMRREEETEEHDGRRQSRLTLLEMFPFQRALVQYLLSTRTQS